jgi:hypothetical protein
MEEDPTKWRYLGDGLYATYDGYQLWLIAYNGIEILNRVALDEHTYAAMLDFIREKEP